MQKKIFLICFFIFLFHSKAYSGETEGEARYLRAHFIFLDNCYNEYWGFEDIYFDENLPREAAGSEQTILLFELLFQKGSYMPPDVRVLSAETDGEGLTLNVSGDILYYYGSYMEARLKAQIIKTALDIPGIKNITLLTEGELIPLREGSTIEKSAEWQDLGF